MVRAASPLLLLLSLPLPARADDDARAAWLARHAAAVRSIDPGDEDFSDLEPLAAAIGTARVVALGEPTHGDGAAFLAKRRLVRFLHRRMGFDVLAWESGLFDCREMDARLLAGETPQRAGDFGIFPIWNASKHVSPVLAEGSPRVGPRGRVEMAGFDCQFSSPKAEERCRDAVHAYLAAIRPAPLTPAEASRLDAFLTGLAGEAGAEGDAAKAERAFVQQVAAKLDPDAPVIAAAHPRRETLFVRRVLNSAAAFDESRRDKGDSPAATNRRDREMGENLAWLAREYYPDRKIIVWAASFHLMRDPAGIKPLDAGLDYADTVPMGTVARQRLGKDYYAVMFVAHEGSWANPFMGRAVPVPEPRDGSLEALFRTAGPEAAFLDLRRVPAGGEWLGEPIVAAPLGYGAMRARWGEHFDGVFYTRTMFPSTTDGKVPEGVIKPRPAQSDALTDFLEEFRKSQVVHPLDPSEDAAVPWKPADPRRLGDYPPGSWPAPLGHIDTDAADFRRVPVGAAPPEVVSAPLALAGPLSTAMRVRDGYATVACLGGVTATGGLKSDTFATLAVRGEMAGRANFDSYSNVFISGDVTGSVTLNSYAGVLVTGRFRGRLLANSRAGIKLLGGLDPAASIELADSRLYVAGRTPRSTLERVTAAFGTRPSVFLEDSDLPPGEHAIRGLRVTVRGK